MTRLFVYRIKTDSGAAPHISDGYLTLTICKPEIRKEAKNGEYVLALVARTSNAMKTLKKKVAKNDIPFLAAYLFRVGDVIPMEQYDKWCTDHAPHKLCTEEHFEGNAQYNKNLKWRRGPHPESFRELNIGGCNSLTSSHFAAWTSTSPHRLTVEEIEGLGLTEEDIVKIGIGHKIVEMPNTVMAERLIASKALPANTNKKCSGAKCGSKNNTAKVNRSKANNNGPRGAGAGPGAPEPPKGREGYTIF
jgi:hypothetical protein